jgi:4'-phosphopantetheinyl transferase
MSPTPALSDDAVHVWPIDLGISPNERATNFSWLAEDEKSRAKSFSFPHLQGRYVAGRGTLRRILARYLKCKPSELTFSYTSFGKPFLRDEPESGLRFNLSHSEDHALLAVTRGRAIGVDIEHIRPDFATLEIAQRFFSESECQALLRIPEAERAIAFFRCWTRKEAFIKAIGEGLSFPLDAFAVTLAPSEPAALRWLRDDANGKERWRLHDLSAPPGYLAALAVEAGAERVVVQSL